MRKVPVPCRDLRFLVVEDHDFQRKLFMQMLQSLGAAAVHGAEDGAAAMRVLRDPDRPVDVVISDLAMPGMDGMAFVRHLSESGARVSLILASALEPELLLSTAHMARAYAVDLLGVISKPPTAVKLTPLLQLHRARTQGGAVDALAYGFDEIADAWASGAFETWFEPKVELATGAVRGMHAVARWRHPTQGLLAPEAFMPSIRARGLQEDFMWKMLRNSAARCGQWLAAGHTLAVSLPLGLASVADLQIADRAARIVRNEDLEARHIILGVAEPALEAGTAKPLENLARLRLQGFGLAIDDFGHGAMALDRLAQFAFTELRIGPAQVAGWERDAGARAELAVALEAAQQLRVKAVADGVASAGQWQLLREWGCDLAQGPFIAPALPGEAVTGWLAGWKAPA
jgi:EAL domain-containing protein (putative c-di-GMP-specific phosphodiesterase class I)